MAKPTSLPDWATDANYPAGAEPEAGTPTKVNYTSGQAANGWRPDQRPTAQEDNYQRNLAGQWIRWMESRRGDDIILGPFAGVATANWAGHVDGYMKSSGAGSLLVGLPLVQGERLRRLSFGVAGDSVANVTVSLKKSVAGVVTTLASKVVTAPDATLDSTNFYLLDFLARVGPPESLAINSGTPALNCASVNFVDLGFWIGMQVTMANFANAGNNVTKTLSGVGLNTLIFTSGAGLVTESGGGDETVTAVMPDLTAAHTNIYLDFAASGANIQIHDVRYAKDDGSVLS